MAEDNVTLIDPNLNAVVDSLDLFKEGVMLFYDMLERFPDRFKDQHMREQASIAAAEAAQAFTAGLFEIRDRREELLRRREERDASRQL